MLHLAVVLCAQNLVFFLLIVEELYLLSFPLSVLFLRSHACTLVRTVFLICNAIRFQVNVVEKRLGRILEPVSVLFSHRPVRYAALAL